MTSIKVGFCVAYDWYLLRYAIPAVYHQADTIVISIDRLHKTWAGEQYEFDEQAFNQFIRALDVNQKIELYVDDFYNPDLPASENEVHQRQKLSEAMGAGGWHIQLDCDEYFLQFAEFVKYLKSLPNTHKPFNVCCPLMTIFKEVAGGYLGVQPNDARQIEFIQIASQSPQYLYGRRNGHFNVYSNFLILHQSWARSEQELNQKIANWGHNRDFNPIAFIDFWKSLNSNNYKSAKNFHPLVPSLWAALEFYRAPNMNELIKNFPQANFPKLSAWQLRIKNSRLLAKLRALLK